MKDWFLKTFIEGRDNRTEFWVKQFVCLGTFVVISILLNIAYFLLQGIPFDLALFLSRTGYLAGVSFALVLPLLFVKRLRELNQSPWWSLVWFIPYIDLILVVYCGFFPSAQERVEVKA